MFESIKNSWEMTKASLEVMKKDKELFLFPILGGIFSVLFVIAILFPTVIAALLKGVAPGAITTTVWYTVVFLVYFGLAFIATFFNTCVVYTAKTRFGGGNATFMDSIKFAASRIHLIFMWAIVSATVGLLLRILDNIAENMGELGQLVMSILIGMLGAAWSFITIFIVPIMVYEGKSPFAALKRSMELLKKTWGEGIVGMVGLGVTQMIFIVIGVVIGVVLFLVTMSLGLIAFIIAMGFVALYFIIVFTFFSALTAIFDTALYIYATEGKMPGGFDEEKVKSSVKHKKK